MSRHLPALPRLLAAAIPLVGAVLVIADRLQPVGDDDLPPALSSEILDAQKVHKPSVAAPQPADPEPRSQVDTTAEAREAGPPEQQGARWTKMRPRARPADLLSSARSALATSPRPRPRPAAVHVADRAPVSSLLPMPRDSVAVAVSRGNAVPAELTAAAYAAASDTLDVPPRISDLVTEARALVSNPPRSLEGAHALSCLAVSIYHEARGEPALGQRGVAAVIYRRATHPSRWGDTICEVVRPVQFSYLEADLGFADITDLDAWRRAVVIAAETLIHGPHERLATADHYHAAKVAPAWREQMVVVARIADHVFLKDR